jgi:hypothetical protein
MRPPVRRDPDLGAGFLVCGVAGFHLCVTLRVTGHQYQALVRLPTMDRAVLTIRPFRKRPWDIPGILGFKYIFRLVI